MKGCDNISLSQNGFERSNHPDDYFISLSFEYGFEFEFSVGEGKVSDEEEIYFAMNKPYTYTRLIDYLH